LEVSGEDRRLPAEVETALFRIGQEALSNVAKHANASNVILSVEFEKDAVAVEVEDDGQGFDPSAVQQVPAGPVGWGILGMKERTSLLRGTLEISSQPGAGTRVRATIPLETEGDSDGQDKSPHSR
jgi:signal transduction histidine kinase